MNPYDERDLRNYLRDPTTSAPTSLFTGAFLIPFKYGLWMSYVCRKPLCGKVWRFALERDEHEKKKCHYSHLYVLQDWNLLETGDATPPHADTSHAPTFYDFDDITDETNVEFEDEGARVTLTYQLSIQMFCSSLGNNAFCWT